MLKFTNTRGVLTVAQLAVLLFISVIPANAIRSRKPAETPGFDLLISQDGLLLRQTLEDSLRSVSTDVVLPERKHSASPQQDQDKKVKSSVRRPKVMRVLIRTSRDPIAKKLAIKVNRLKIKLQNQQIPDDPPVGPGDESAGAGTTWWGCMKQCLKSSGVSTYAILVCGVACVAGLVPACAICLGVDLFLVEICGYLCAVNT